MHKFVTVSKKLMLYSILILLVVKFEKCRQINAALCMQTYSALMSHMHVNKVPQQVEEA